MRHAQFDQAAGLRRLFGQPVVQSVAITSAAIVANRHILVANAISQLAGRGRRVLLIDENPAPRNAASLLFQNRERQVGDLLQVLRGEISLQQAVLRHGAGFSLIAASRLANSELPVSKRISELLQSLESDRDYLVIDCAMSRSMHISALAQRAYHQVVVVTLESSGIMQAYSHLKRMAQTHHRDHFHILINGNCSRDEARVIFNNLRQVAQDRLDIRLAYLGLIGPQSATNFAEQLDSGLTSPQDVAIDPVAGLSIALERMGGQVPHDSVL